MTLDRAIRLARVWAFGGVCTLQDGEAQAYHKLALAVMSDRAVQLVRCRECKYRDSEDNWCHFWGSSINRYDFCSRGEKKGGR